MRFTLPRQLHTIALLVALAFIALQPPASAQMRLTDAQQKIVADLAAQNPTLARGTDDQRRALTRTIIEQLVFTYPDQGFGWKSADPTRPPSKDGIAIKRGATLYGCDWQSGSSREAYPVINCEDISGQHFIAVAGVDHLGGAKPPAPNAPQADDLAALMQQLDALRAEILAVRSQLANAEARLAAVDERTTDAPVVSQQAAQLAARVESLEAAIARIDAYLADKPIPTACSASVFGLPGRCDLR